MGSLFDRLANLLYGFLPALLSPERPTTLTQNRYLPAYSDKIARTVLALGDHYLEPWEADVLDRYRIQAGKMLVLGSGWGREAIALARRGITVFGVDTNWIALRTADRSAKAIGVPARFHQADFLHLPYATAGFDSALLSSIMYSAIPGSAQRQAWLADIRRVLKPEGLLLLSFARADGSASRRRAVATGVNRLLVRLPGANQAYQPGDDCEDGHFLHTFQDEAEIRTELINAGITLRELNWARGFAVCARAPALDMNPVERYPDTRSSTPREQFRRSLP